MCECKRVDAAEEECRKLSPLSPTRSRDAIADSFSSRSGTFLELKHYQPRKYNPEKIARFFFFSSQKALEKVKLFVCEPRNRDF